MKWLYQENQKTTVDYQSSVKAAAYDSKMEKFRNYQAEGQALQKALKLNPGSTVIDLGTGTGALALELAAYCQHIDAVDISPEMLKTARSKAAARGITNISWHCAGFLSYTHQAETADAVITRAALHHLPDFWKVIALTRIYHWLKPGGVFLCSDVVFSFQPAEWEEKFDSYYQNLGTIAGEAMAREARVHFLEEFSTFDWLFEAMLHKTGFEVVSRNTTDGMMQDYLCRKPHKEESR